MATSKKTATNEVAAVQALDLAQLGQIGGLLTGKAASREVTWKRLDDDGNEVEHTFIVGVVKLGIAAAERIWAVAGDKSRCATIIHETIRLGADFKQRITYEDACRLEPSLFAALSGVADSVNPKPKTIEAEGEEGKG